MEAVFFGFAVAFLLLHTTLQIQFRKFSTSATPAFIGFYAFNVLIHSILAFSIVIKWKGTFFYASTHKSGEMEIQAQQPGLN